MYEQMYKRALYVWLSQMRETSQEAIEKLALAVALFTSGYSFNQSAKISGMNTGQLYYHLKRLGFEIKKAEELSKLDTRVLNANLANQARYYLDSCQLHLNGLRYGHERNPKGVTIGLWLMAIRERSSKTVGYQLVTRRPDSLQWSRFIREQSGNLVKGSVLLSDVSNGEFCGEFAESCTALGFTLVRVRGWINNGQTKPWIEGLFGTFQTQWRLRIKEYLGKKAVKKHEALSIDGLREYTALLLGELIGNIKPLAELKPLEIVAQ